jgi:uncharacterized protein YndB with AHSA1/START domain
VTKAGNVQLPRIDVRRLPVRGSISFARLIRAIQEAVMPSASRSIVVSRPVEEVFAFFTDPANDQKWRPHVKEMAAQGPPGVGAKIHQVVSGPGGRGIPADIEVTAYEPPTRYAFRVVAGPARPVGDFRLVATGTSTQVTFSLEAELGGLKKLFMSTPVQKSMDGEMAALDTAKGLIETAGG